MRKNRLEAFSDGVLAIIITIMVLELEVPHETDVSALRPLLGIFLSYVLSFVYIGIYWNNHHHLLHAATTVSGRIMWANMHLLFWLSLLPFATAWAGENNFAPVPTALYGLVLLLAAIAYYILEAALIRQQGRDGPLARAVGRDWKGKASPGIYLLGLALTFIHPLAGLAAFTLVALIWLVPDRRLERYVARASARPPGGRE
jgi:uncharacterized membrane protein